MDLALLPHSHLPHARAFPRVLGCPRAARVLGFPRARALRALLLAHAGGVGRGAVVVAVVVVVVVVVAAVVVVVVVVALVVVVVYAVSRQLLRMDGRPVIDALRRLHGRA